MKRRIVAGVLLLVAVGCSTQPSVPDYASGLAEDRLAKNAMFRQASDSPIPAAARDRFLPLAYYAIDPRYRAAASLAAADPAQQPVVEMPTSTGQRRMMQRAGSLRFSVDGRPLELAAFVAADDPGRRRLFVPFGDLTNGLETYQAGRYLDLDQTSTGLYDLDFNRAYQPYCYFDPRYDCPIPPRENRLDLPVRAGERMRPPASEVP